MRPIYLPPARPRSLTDRILDVAEALGSALPAGAAVMLFGLATILICGGL